MTARALDDEERAVLLEALRPWMRVLRERTSLTSVYDIQRASPNDVVWLRLRATWELDPRVFEAFELLALAGGVDVQLWRLAFASATTERMLRIDGPLTQKPVCRIGCALSFSGIEEFPNAVLAWCGRIVAGADPHTASNEYTRARQWLENLYHENAISGSACAEIPVSLWLHEGTFEERMHQLAEVVSMRPPRHDASTHMPSEPVWKPLFRFTEVDPGNPDEVTADAFRFMTEIASHGVRIDKFKPSNTVVTNETAAMFARGLQGLLDSTDLSHADSTFAAVKTVELPVYLPRRTVTAIFSALRTSRSVEVMYINCALSPWQPDPDDAPTMARPERDHLWQWIAFSVFSEHAAHCMNRIHINVDTLSVEDIRAFRSQLDRGHCYRTVDQIASTWSIAPMAVVDGTLPSNGTIELPRHQVMIVGAKQRDMFQALVPGYGIVNVRAEDMPTNSEASSRRGCAVKLLSLENVHDRSRAPVLELLQSAGQDVTQLVIFQMDCSGVLDGWVCGLFDACPRLEVLTVHGRLALRSMDTVTATLEHATCRLQRLRIDHLTVVDVASVPLFFQKLIELRLQFQQLELTVAGLENAGDGVSIVDAVGSLLRRNHTLRVLNLNLAYEPLAIISTELCNGVKQLGAHHLEPIAVRRAPLGIDKKLAFLSVLKFFELSKRGPVGQSHSVTAPQSMPRMDRPLVAIVFAFAADCDRRSVAIRLSRDDD